MTQNFKNDRFCSEKINKRIRHDDAELNKENAKQKLFSAMFFSKIYVLNVIQLENRFVVIFYRFTGERVVILMKKMKLKKNFVKIHRNFQRIENDESKLEFDIDLKLKFVEIRR